LRFLINLLLVFAKKLIITSVFEKKTPFFRRKLAKIAENDDHNIDPRLLPSSSQSTSGLPVDQLESLSLGVLEGKSVRQEVQLERGLLGCKSRVSIQKPGTNPTTFEFTATTPAL
jgi:hypothetical protein